MQVFGTALLIVALSLLLGRAICMRCGGGGVWPAAPAVGLSALIVLSGAAVKLPGRVTTAIVVIVVVSLAAATFLLRRDPGRQPYRRSLAADAVVTALALVGGSIPFIANGRIALQGVSLDNDTAAHLLLAEAVRSPRMAALWGSGHGYPTGPHSLVATLGSATGMSLDLVFCALLLALIPITALVAAEALSSSALWRRALTGLLASLAYLAAAFYAEGAFKELIMGGLLLAFVLQLEHLREAWPRRTGAERWRLVLPAAVMVAGGIYTYSYLALAWFGLTVVVWLAAEAAIRPASVKRYLTRPNLMVGAGWGALTAAVMILLLVPVAGQTFSFFNAVGVSTTGAIAKNNLGNLAGPLSPYEALGIWLSPDFRRTPVNGFHAGELAAFALAVLLAGIYIAWRRRQLPMLAAMLASAIIWVYSDHAQSPYVAAKALVIPAALVVTLNLRSLLARQGGTMNLRALRAGAAALFCAFAAYSSYQTLRNEPVQTHEEGQELASFHRLIGNREVLFLGDDDYSSWELRASSVGALSPTSASRGGAMTRATKPYVAGQMLDFDSVNPADLDRFPYVITASSPYASQPPRNFRLLRSSRLYELWERVGPTAARWTLERSGAPGFRLDCSTPTGRGLSSAPGFASVSAAPVSTPGVALSRGQSASIQLSLPPGAWQLSMQYVSPVQINVAAEDRHWTMPAYLGRRGPFFVVGPVDAAGYRSPLVIRITARRPSPLSGQDLIAVIPTLVATRVPDTRRIVSLAAACGRYIDWYRISVRPGANRS